MGVSSGIRSTVSQPHPEAESVEPVVLDPRMGGTFEEAADILGDSETITRKHYAKWSAGRQARISGLLARIWDAEKWNPEVPKNEWDGLVDEMGFEPTTPALRTPCSPS